MPARLGYRYPFACVAVNLEEATSLRPGNLLTRVTGLGC